jgi:hypothetical protein
VEGGQANPLGDQGGVSALLHRGTFRTGRTVPYRSLHHVLIKGLTYLSFGTRPGEKPLE